MIDRGVVGCNWIELPAGKYTIRDPSACKSTCQLEIDIAYDEMVSHKTEGIYSEIVRNTSTKQSLLHITYIIYFLK